MLSFDADVLSFIGGPYEVEVYIVEVDGREQVGGLVLRRNFPERLRLAVSQVVPIIELGKELASWRILLLWMVPVVELCKELLCSRWFLGALEGALRSMRRVLVLSRP